MKGIIGLIISLSAVVLGIIFKDVALEVYYYLGIGLFSILTIVFLFIVLLRSGSGLRGPGHHPDEDCADCPDKEKEETK